MAHKTSETSAHGCGGGIVRDGDKVKTIEPTKPANGLPKLDAADDVYQVFLDHLRGAQPDPSGKAPKLTPELKTSFKGITGPIRDRAWSTYTLEVQVADNVEANTGDKQ